MDKRPMRELLRKRKNTFFRKGHETSSVYEVNVLFLVDNNNKLDIYGSMDNPAGLLSDEYKAGKAINLKRNFKTTPRMKEAASRRNETSECHPSLSKGPSVSTVATPKLDVYPRGGLGGWKGFIYGFVVHGRTVNHLMEETMNSEGKGEPCSNEDKNT
ncbi:hypothetical protein V493_00763 [Pseudogymnoascus sp. VKM F-4281 (FW-2241)]|nr:hypothetical protein V493_00763 [Pseudogymnoascus sp. VKM F-4281 (FW-2241)]